MPLKRATKTIPLTGGITEEVDDFLLEPAGMQYMENLRFPKKDVAEKFLPTKDGIVTGAASYSADYNAFYFKDDQNGAVVDLRRVLQTEDGGANWTSYPQNADLVGVTKVLSSLERAGVANIQMVPLTTDSSGRPDTIYSFAVAYEVRKFSGGTSSCDVWCEVYNEDATRKGVQIYEDMCGPRLQKTGGASGVTTHCFMTDTSNGDLNVALCALDVWGPTPTTYARSIQTYPQMFEGMGVGDGWDVGGTTPISAEEMRIGWSQELLETSSSLVYYQRPFATGNSGVYAYKNSATGDITWQRVTSAGVPTGTSQVIATGDAFSNRLMVLDATCNDTHVYVLYAAVDQTTGVPSTDIKLAKEPIGGGTITTITCETWGGYIPVNGSVRFGNASTNDGNTNEDDVCVAWTAAFGQPDVLINAALLPHQVRHLFIDDPFGTPTTKTTILSSQRLVTNIMRETTAGASADRPVFAVQQWLNWSPFSSASIDADPNVPALLTPAQKPKTTVIVAINTAETDPTYDIVGQMDAGQGQAKSPGHDEHDIGLASLWLFNNGIGDTGRWQLYVGNRQLLTLDDYWHFLAKTAGQAWPTNDARRTMTLGSSRMNLYHFSSTLPVPQLDFPDGCFVGTSLPVWYDGSRDLQEQTPLESPEIHYATMSGDGALYIAYQDLFGTGADEPKIVQVVVGYVDNNNRVHRSAPSAALYVGNATAITSGAGTAERISIGVTLPLTMQRNRRYFLEAYEAHVGDDPVLCATAEFNPGADTSLFLNWESNLRPMNIGLKDLTPFRASKTLYTAGNVLASDPWPTFDFIAKSGRRLFAHAVGDVSTIYYSKLFENGLAPEFSASLTISLGNERVTAMASIDDKLICFTPNETWLVYGSGPDNTGANGDFVVERLPMKHGCTEPDSVVQYEDGIAFFSNTTKEFAVITRDLQALDIGEGVKVMSEGVTAVRAGIVVPNDHEIRWYCDQTPGSQYTVPQAANSKQPVIPFLENQPPTEFSFVYNYKYAKWSVKEELRTYDNVTDQEGKWAGIANGVYYGQADDFTGRVESVCKWETPWIKVNQLQDFGRFYGATFLGKYLSSWNDDGLGRKAGDLWVTVKYDYENNTTADTDTYVFRANQDFSPEEGERLQFRIRPKRQKCQAIKFILEEKLTTAIEVWEPTYAIGRGFSMLAVDLDYGAKGGSGDKNLGSKRRKG